MTKNRFQQLKRYFRISEPLHHPPVRGHWFDKLEPLSSDLQHRYQQYCTPATEVAVDEMMVRFVGRSVHTVRIPNKPIPDGFKILALCKHGYTYSFMYTSRVDQFSGHRYSLQNALPNPEDG